MSKHINILFALSMLASGVYAQEEGDTPNLNQEIVTVGERELKLKDAFKANFYPTEVDTTIKKEDLSYQFLPGFVKTNYEPDTIEAAKLKVVEPLSKLYPGYIKLGVGNYSMPYGELYYGSNRNRNGLFAVKLSHLSSKEQQDPFSSSLSNTQGAFWYKRFLKKSAFSTQISGGRESRSYYNQYRLNPNINLTPEETDAAMLSQNRTLVHGAALLQLQSYDKGDDAFNHHEKLSFRYTDGNFSTSEINAKISTQLEKYYNQEIYKGDLSVEQNIYKNADSSYNQSNTLIYLSPHISTRTEQVQVDLGLGVYSFLDNGRSYFYFVPKAKASYTGIERYAVPYLGIDGDVSINTFSSLMGQNMFYEAIPELRLSRENLHLYLGLRGRISDKSSYNLKAFRMRNVDKPIYLINPASTDRPFADFEIAYQSYNHFGVLAEYSLELGAKFSSRLQFIYNQYSIDSLINLPKYEVNANLTYNFNDKLLLAANAHFVPERTGVTVLDGNQRVDGNLGNIVDVSFNAEYRYTRRLAVFLNLANISNKRYQLLPEYQVLGFSVLGGINFSF